jgi:hypothetical protein
VISFETIDGFVDILQWTLQKNEEKKCYFIKTMHCVTNQSKRRQNCMNFFPIHHILQIWPLVTFFWGKKDTKIADLFLHITLPYLANLLSRVVQHKLCVLYNTHYCWIDTHWYATVNQTTCWFNPQSLFLFTRIRVESSSVWLNENKNNNEKTQKLSTILVSVDLKFMCIMMCLK